MSDRGAALPGTPEPPSRSRIALRALGVLALLGALFAAAYVLELGPFDDDTLSRAQLIAEGDEICEAAREAFAELQSKPLATAAQQATLTEQLVGIARDESSELAALQGPAEVEDDLAGYLAAREQGISLLERGHQAAERGDEDAYERAQVELDDSQAERTALARDIGFGACSKPLSLG